MDEILQTITVLARWLLYVGGGIVTLGGAWTVIDRLRTPTRKLKTEVAELKERMTRLEEHHKNDQDANDEKFLRDLKALEELTDSNRHMCGAMLALLDHMISGNSVDKMKEVRDDMRDFIIKKS